MTFAYVSILCLDIINVTTLICNCFVVAKTPQKPYAKTPQKPRKNLLCPKNCLDKISDKKSFMKILTQKLQKYPKTF